MLLRGEIGFGQQGPDRRGAFSDLGLFHGRQLFAGQHVHQLGGIGFRFHNPLQADGDAAQFTGKKIFHLSDGNFHEFRQLFSGWAEAVSLHQARLCCPQFCELLIHIYGNANRAALGGERSIQALPNPPIGIGGETMATGGVIFLDGTGQAESSLLNQIEKIQAFALITLGQIDNKAEV